MKSIRNPDYDTDTDNAAATASSARLAVLDKKISQIITRI